MRGADDPAPIVLDTCMRLTQVRWNTRGTVLAVAGSQVTTAANGDQREMSMVFFYSAQGRFLRTLKVGDQ